MHTSHRHAAPPGRRDLARLGADLLARRGLAGLAADLDVITHAVMEAADRFQGDAALILGRVDYAAIEDAASRIRAAEARAFDPDAPVRFDADSRAAVPGTSGGFSLADLIEADCRGIDRLFLREGAR
jgi:hypothetical protein